MRTKVSELVLCALPLVLSSAIAGTSGLPNRAVSLGPDLSMYVEQGLSVSIAVKSDGEATMLDGPFSVRFADGTIAVEGQLKSGQFHGPKVWYDSNGQMRGRGVYRDGIPVGQEVWWDQFGAVSRILNLDDQGALHGVDSYFSGGTLVRMIEWNHGEPVVMREYEDGTVVRTSSPEQVWEYFEQRRLKREAQPGATDNPGDAQ